MTTTQKLSAEEQADPASAAEDSAPQDEHDVQEEYQFTPKLSPAWALNLEQLAAVGIFGVLYVLLNSFPLQVTDIWGHVEYGKWILAEGGLPTEDPWMSLAQGMKVVDSAWLSQVILGGVDYLLGPEALSHLFALVSLAAYIFWARIFFLQTGRVWMSVACTALVVLIGWSRVATIRPENFAVLCFATIMLLVVRRDLFHNRISAGGEKSKFDAWTWIGVPVLFALWANLHGSFVIGLTVLFCFLAGRILEVLWQTRSLTRVLQDQVTRSWLYLLEISAAATLLNPYGLDLWIYTLGFASNMNLSTVLEWEPMLLFGVGGRSFAISVVLLLFVWRQSQRPIRPVDVLLLAAFGFASVSGIRMLSWYALMFVMPFAPHIADIVSRWFPALAARPVEESDAATATTALAGETEEEAVYELPPGQSFRYSLAAVLLIWIAFALSPSSQIIFKKARDRDALYWSNTPYQLTDYLNEAYSADAADPLPGGQAFHPQWWGDWLVHEGPEKFQPFVTTNIHLVPERVWEDHARILDMRDGWQGALDRYDVTTVIVDRKLHAAMYRSLNRNDDWQRKYEDDLSAVFVRRGRQPENTRDDRSPPPENTTREREPAA